MDNQITAEFSLNTLCTLFRHYQTIIKMYVVFFFFSSQGISLYSSDYQKNLMPAASS